jgi:hypothetical protein
VVSPSPSSGVAPSASGVEGRQSVAPINYGRRITATSRSGRQCHKAFTTEHDMSMLPA